jgi:hypothetical protein
MLIFRPPFGRESYSQVLRIAAATTSMLETHDRTIFLAFLGLEYLSILLFGADVVLLFISSTGGDKDRLRIQEDPGFVG